MEHFCLGEVAVDRQIRFKRCEEEAFMRSVGVSFLFIEEVKLMALIIHSCWVARSESRRESVGFNHRTCEV